MASSNGAGSLKRFFITLGILLVITPLFLFIISSLFMYNYATVMVLITLYLMGASLWLGMSTRRVGPLYVSLHIANWILGLGLALMANNYISSTAIVFFLALSFIINIVLACLAPFIFSLKERLPFFQAPQQPQQPQPAPQPQGQQIVYQQVIYVPYDPNAPDAPKVPPIPQMPPMPSQQHDYQEGYRPAQPQPKEEYNHYEEGSRTFTYPTTPASITQSQARTQYPTV